MDNNKFGNIIAICAFWVVVMEGYTSKELRGIFLFIAVVTGLILTVIAIGVDYVEKTIKEVFESFRKVFHDAFMIIIIGFDAFQLFISVVKHFFPKQADYIIRPNSYSLSIVHCAILFLMFLVLYVIYKYRYYNWISCELMLLSFTIPAVHKWLENNNTASVPFNQVYLAIIMVLCIWYLLRSRNRRQVEYLQEEYVFCAITVSSIIGYIQRVVHYRYVSYLRLFIITYLMECLVHAIRQAFVDNND